VRTALDRAAVRIAGKFDRQPEVEAAIRDTIGQTYIGLGLYPEARTQLERALELHRRMLGAKNPKTLETISHLGLTALLEGKGRAHEWIVQLYQAWGRPEKAAEWGKK
jgi:eukaryotic-like serine/threonine-protein kinase